MDLDNSLKTTQSSTIDTDWRKSGVRLLRKHPEIWIALLLWFASNVFVGAFANLARWEFAGQYYKMQDLCRWDCNWYGTVVAEGYDRSAFRETSEANWAFSPVFPLTAYPFYHWFKLSAPLSMVLASKAALLLAIYSFMLMVRDMTDNVGDRFLAGSLVAFNPYLIYGHAGYAEPLFFALLTLAFFFAWQRRWLLSGLAGGLVSGTRILGFLFASSYTLVCLRDAGWRRFWRRFTPVQLIGLLLCPLGTSLFMLYLYHVSGDALAQAHIQVAWNRAVGGNPFHTLMICFKYHHWLRVWGVMAIAGLLIGVWELFSDKPELGIFLIPYLLIPLASSYKAVPRYVFWQPAFLYAIFLILRRYRSWWPVYIAFAAGMACFVVVGWVTGRDFVI